MEFGLDRDSDVPVGVQLVWGLRSRILAGDLSPGDRLPGVRELAAEAGVNINTARAVYARLESDGLLHAEHGRGTFVADDVAIDDRLASAARRALAEARSAGLDPRELAAALFSGAAAPRAPVADDAEPAARRRVLRDQIASLERELADERLARALRDAEPAAPWPAGGRLLSEDELRAQRDELAARLLALRAAAPEREPGPEAQPAAVAAPSRRSVTRPGVTWRPVFGA